jgi:inorganic phosphate transporter, PiT family
MDKKLFLRKTVLDKDFKKLSGIETATRERARHFLPASLSVLFLVLAGLAAFAMSGIGGGWTIIVGAAVVGGYMALNIGANDVANNMSPAVGSRTLTIGVAVAIAAIFEAAGAIIAGGDVVATVASGIIRPAMLPSTADFVTAMIAALFAAALWLNIATALGAPVSTTHSIVGGVLGGGIAISGLGVADWNVVTRIFASWVISPVMGGVIAAAFLAYIKFKILFAEDKLEQARRRVPMLVGIMAGAFVTYLLLKGLKRVVDVPVWLAVVAGIVVLLLTRALMRPVVANKVTGLSGRRHSVGELFTVPVICGAALLSFAHGSNDVANAIGPLAAIYTSVAEGRMAAEARIPLWALLIGALGISTGLLLYGPKLIRVVGSRITKLNRVRAFCVTLSAAITVIIASSLGLPVSSTHIAIGALFGVGFLREFLEKRRLVDVMPLKPPEPPIDPTTGEPLLGDKFRKARRRYLVRRSHILTIVAAWIITVPATAAMAGLFALGLLSFEVIRMP